MLYLQNARNDCAFLATLLLSNCSMYVIFNCLKSCFLVTHVCLICLFHTVPCCLYFTVTKADIHFNLPHYFCNMLLFNLSYNPNCACCEFLKVIIFFQYCVFCLITSCFSFWILPSLLPSLD